jgi:hypothetical protein
MSPHQLSKFAAGIAVAGALFTSSTAGAWTVDANFESGVVGEKANGSDGFGGAFKYTVYSDVVAHSGSQAAEIGIDQGAEGFGDWGGSFQYPDLMQGDEIWFRVYAYFPSGFDFSCTQCAGLKMMRIHTAAQDSSNEGYLDVLISGGLNVGSEVTPDYYQNNPTWKNLGTEVVTGEWLAVEQYVKLSSVPGEGIYRVWQNGTLIKEDLQTKTLRTTSSISDFIYLFSYWNGTAPQTQVAYVDDVFITNETPAAVDADGNAFIGLTDTPPSPGTGGAGGSGVGSGTGGAGQGAGDSGGGAPSGGTGSGNGVVADGSANDNGGCNVGSRPPSDRTPWAGLLLAGLIAARLRFTTRLGFTGRRRNAAV